MAENPFKRYLDTGMAFSALTQARAEAIVKDLVRSGEVQSEQAQSTVSELVDRSRRNTERFVESVRAEVREQVRSLGLATQDDIARLEDKIGAVTTASPSRRAAGRKAASTRQGATKKATATRKVAGRKAAATRTAKRSARTVAGKKAAATRAAKQA